MNSFEQMQAKLIQEQQAKIEVLTEQFNEIRDALMALQIAYAESQITNIKERL